MIKRFLAALVATAVIGVTPVDAKTLRWASQGDPQTADPFSQNEGLTNMFSQSVHDTLVMRDNTLKLVPGLATSWQQVNPTTWRFMLRQGVKFHDGSPFTADDIVFSYERASHADLAAAAVRDPGRASRARSMTSPSSSCRTSRIRSRSSTRRRFTS